MNGAARLGIAGRLLASASVVAVVTAVIAVADGFVPVLSLGALYVFAVLPVAVFFGTRYAIAVAVASMLAFNWFFLEPVHRFTLAERSNWFALAVYLVVAVVVSELAARARTRAAEAEQRERERAVLADVAVSLLQGEGLEGRIEQIAAAAARALGVDEARLELGQPRSAPAGESPLELVAGDRRVGTLYVRNAEAPSLAVRKRFLPALASLLAVAVDRAELEREAFAAERLRLSDTVKTAVLRAASHDLRSPLTAIRVAAESLTNPELALSEEDARRQLETVYVESRRLDRLVANLLDLSRLEAGAAGPHPELVSVDELVGQALAQLGELGDRVHVQLPDDVPLVEVDPRQVERALVNLLENAVRFSPPREDVHVRVTATRKEAIVRVVDHGPGIAEGDFEHLFDAFAFEHDGDERHGTGLGLAIVRGFTEANGGRVWAESRPGQGATFALAFPLVPAAVAR
jgi:two-component system sensor histidine kinase KdpD